MDIPTAKKLSQQIYHEMRAREEAARELEAGNVNNRDLLIGDVAQASDSALLNGIDWCDEIVNELSERIKETRQRQNEYKTEFKRRCLEAYWAANPDKQRVSEGDLIADNPLWNKGRITHRNQLRHIDPYQRVCTVVTFTHEKSQPRSIFGVPLESVCKARREFLQAVQS